jgi:hypothetical protein
LAATAPPLRLLERERSSITLRRSHAGVVAVTSLTFLALIIHGYHPYAEDGGLYLAGIKRVLHPDLYPYWTGFTTAHLRFSLFAPFVALLVRITRLDLMNVMLLLYAGSIWGTLFAAWQIAVRCFVRMEACVGAVSLVALLLTVPVAGTSLMFMDPYVSARSISTPCGLLALAAASDVARQIRNREQIARGRAVLCIATLVLAFLVHPLMGAYSLGCVLVFGIATVLGNREQWPAWGLLCVLTIAVAVLIALAPAGPPGYAEVARTRTYWFLSEWHWYEDAGLAAPLFVLGWLRFRARSWSSETLKSFAQMGLIVGALSIMVALMFARTAMPTYAVARLQPLRVFQTVYALTIMCVGALLGELVLKRSAWRWLAMGSVVGALMFFVQCAAFPNSSHLEFPWVAPANGWEQAFEWIRNHTATDATFAVDADYITAPGEDAQNFRAIAERSVIPDYSKDGGIASIAPDLTRQWLQGEAAQKGLDRATDAERIKALRAVPVQWIVLSRNAMTAFPCDYVNAAVKVCRPQLRPRDSVAANGAKHP